MSAAKVGTTPGPWRATPHSSIVGTGIVANRGIVVASVLGVPEVCQANAHLIASAPDLLALAKRYARECGTCGGTGVKLVWAPNADRYDEWDHSEPCDACSDLRAVIEKAEGRA